MWKRLLHRWFVQYNPLYFASALLVLRGVNLLSAATMHARFGVFIGPAAAEAYAWALVGAAALLFRLGMRRPAVMLALIAVLYQGDLTLHTETSALLGPLGWLSATAWLGSFVLKLLALARALRLRLSRSAVAVPVFGAVGLVAVPRVVQALDARPASLVIGAWLFALATLTLWTRRGVETTFATDDWGKTVLRRARLATWGLWGGLVVLHVAFWFSTRELEPRVLLPVAMVPLARFARRDRAVWMWLGASFAITATAAPAYAPFAAALAAVAFALHGARRALARERVTASIVGLCTAAHVAAWLALGAWDAHVVALDVALGLGLALCAWRLRSAAALAPIAAIGAHGLVVARVVTAPVTALEWGAWLTGAGFVTLAGAVVATVLAERARRPDDDEPAF